MKKRYRKIKINEEKEEKLSYIKPALNWVLFMFTITLSLLSFVYAVNMEDIIDTHFKIIILLLGSGFLICGMKMDDGCEDLKAHYRIFIKNEFIISLLSYLPLLLLITYFLLTVSSIHIGNLLNLSLYSFIFPLIFSCFYFIFKEIKQLVEKELKKK